MGGGQSGLFMGGLFGGRLLKDGLFMGGIFSFNSTVFKWSFSHYSRSLIFSVLKYQVDSLIGDLAGCLKLG